MDSTWTPRRQGDAGELSAMEWFVRAGATLWMSVFTHPDCDLIAEYDERLVRVQVKTCTRWRHNRWEVMLATRGGNQSWNGLVKRLDATRCGVVFVHVADGRRWCIPATALGGGTGILLGGPKYAQYEVEPGEPLRARPPPTPMVPA